MMRAAAWVAVLLLAGCAGPGGKQTDASTAGFSASLSPDTHATPSGTGSSPQGTSAAPASPKAGSIRGLVVDESLHPLAGALVRIPSLRLSTNTSSDGAFGFKGLKAGSYVLEASHLRFQSTQATLEVKAGVDDPQPAKLVLQSIPDAKPRVDTYKLKLVVMGRYCLAVYGCGYIVSGANPVSNDRDFVYTALEPGATGVQSEVDWTAQTPLAQSGSFRCSLSSTGPPSLGATSPWTSGASPLVVRMPGALSKDNATATPNSEHCDFNADIGTGVAGAMAEQDASVYVHAFYNFVPKTDWLFSRDGDYPVPPSLLP